MKLPGRWAMQGQWMRELREQCKLNRSEVENRTDGIARRTNNKSFHVSRTYLRDIELGNCVPGFHKIEALAVVYSRGREELLERYGVTREGRLDLFRSFPPPSGPNRAAEGVDEEELRFLVSIARRIRSKETRLLNETAEALEIPTKWRERAAGISVRFAVIGTQDDTMGEVVPQGSLVAIDVEQKAIDGSAEWSVDADRPVYLVWLEDLYVCCWAYQEGNTLTLIPHQPTAHRPVMHLKTPKQAIIIGRVIQVWRLPLDDVALLDTFLDGKKAEVSG
jgi:transcriptional regulator with XRE-family HTH domain